MTQATVSSNSNGDLVAACLRGERGAFRTLVERHQALVTGVAYSLCGDVPLSEDLAQDTFIAAWKQLAQLQDPERLSAWLCGIVRNQARTALRRSGRRPESRALPLTPDDLPAARGGDPCPSRSALGREQRALLWQQVEALPEPDREVLVLFYRQGRSTAEVAAALEVREDAVRQRLARARRRLKLSLSTFVEEALRQTAPGPAFTVAVMAALPAIAPNLAVAATGASAGAAKSAGSLASLGLWAGPLIWLVGGAIGTAGEIRAARGPRERRILVRTSILGWVSVPLFAGAMLVLSAWEDQIGRQRFLMLVAAVMGAYALTMLGVSIAVNLRIRKIRLEEGSPPPPVADSPWARPAVVYTALAAVVVGAMGWMLGLAAHAGDWAGLALASAAAAGVYAWSTTTIRRHGPRAVRGVLLGVTAAIAVSTLVVINTRLAAWLGAYAGRDPAAVAQDLPLWMLHFTVLMSWLVISVPLWMNRPDAEPAPDSAGGTSGAK